MEELAQATERLVLADSPETPPLRQVRASELAGCGAGQPMQDALPTGNAPSEDPHSLKGARFRVALQTDTPFQEILNSNGLKRLHMA